MSIGEGEAPQNAGVKRDGDKLLSPFWRRVLIVVLGTLLVFQFGELKQALGEEVVRQPPRDAPWAD